MRAYNFNPGTTIIPPRMLEKLNSAFVEYGTSGLGVLELHAGSKAAQELLLTTRATLRRVLNIPEEYGILFLAGDLSMQFAQIPLNLMRNSRADYLLTGKRAQLAKEQADRFGNARVVITGADVDYTNIPNMPRSVFDPSADYTHIVLDNSCHGTTFMGALPDIGDVPLVAEASNCLLFDELDVSRFGLLYADTQSILGAPGMTLVILKNELIRKEPPSSMPTMLSYKRLLEQDVPEASLPISSLLICKLMLEEILLEGGLRSIGRRNREKAARLYDLLDTSRFYQPVADPSCRSLTSVVFRLPTPELTETLLGEAKQAGLLGMKNTTNDGSICIGVCNGINEDGIALLLDFLGRFQRENR